MTNLPGLLTKVLDYRKKGSNIREVGGENDPLSSTHTQELQSQEQIHHGLTHSGMGEVYSSTRPSRQGDRHHLHQAENRRGSSAINQAPQEHQQGSQDILAPEQICL